MFHHSRSNNAINYLQQPTDTHILYWFPATQCYCVSKFILLCCSHPSQKLRIK